jgi:hypothetical protein
MATTATADNIRNKLRVVFISHTHHIVSSSGRHVFSGA